MRAARTCKTRNDLARPLFTRRSSDATSSDATYTAP
jgi:hypothetical protein